MTAAHGPRVGPVATAPTRSVGPSRLVARVPHDPFAEQAEILRLDPLTSVVYDALDCAHDPDELRVAVRAQLPPGVEVDDSTIDLATRRLVEAGVLARPETSPS